MDVPQTLYVHLVWWFPFSRNVVNKLMLNLIIIEVLLRGDIIIIWTAFMYCFMSLFTYVNRCSLSPFSPCPRLHILPGYAVAFLMPTSRWVSVWIGKRSLFWMSWKLCSSYSDLFALHNCQYFSRPVFIKSSNFHYGELAISSVMDSFGDYYIPFFLKTFFFFLQFFFCKMTFL